MQSIGLNDEQKRMRESHDKSHGVRRKALVNEYAMQKDIDQAHTAKELKAKLYSEEVERQVRCRQEFFYPSRRIIYLSRFLADYIFIIIANKYPY